MRAAEQLRLACKHLHIYTIRYLDFDWLDLDKYLTEQSLHYRTVGSGAGHLTR